MRAFQTALTPSKSLQTAALLCHIAAAGLCVFLFDGIYMWGGLAAIAACFAHARQITGLRGSRSVRMIAVDRLGRAMLTLGEQQQAVRATLKGSSVITAYALFLEWQTENGTISHCLMRDMMPSETYRRLKVWALWHPHGHTAARHTTDSV